MEPSCTRWEVACRMLRLIKVACKGSFKGGYSAVVAILRGD